MVIKYSNHNISLLTNIDKDLSNSMNSDVKGLSPACSIQWIGDHIYFHLADGGTVSLYMKPSPLNHINISSITPTSSSFLPTRDMNSIFLP